MRFASSSPWPPKSATSASTIGAYDTSYDVGSCDDAKRRCREVAIGHIILFKQPFTSWHEGRRFSSEASILSAIGVRLEPQMSEIRQGCSSIPETKLAQVVASSSSSSARPYSASGTQIAR